MASKQSAEKFIDSTIIVSIIKMQYFEDIKKKKGFRFFKSHPEIVKNVIANMDNNVFLTPLDHSKPLQINEIKYDDKIISRAFMAEFEKRYPEILSKYFDLRK
ncbi:MAG: hypothetical protein KAH86_07835 [Methanosarcinales archaeon]|nr:hypothetical protein [Methanosarcinales archaeon]